MVSGNGYMLTGGCPISSYRPGMRRQTFLTEGNSAAQPQPKTTNQPRMETTMNANFKNRLVRGLSRRSPRRRIYSRLENPRQEKGSHLWQRKSRKQCGSSNALPDHESLAFLSKSVKHSSLQLSRRGGTGRRAGLKIR